MTPDWRPVSTTAFSPLHVVSLRSESEPARGDWVIGFVSARVGCGLVAWAGQVSDTMTLGEYGSRFSGRTDALYRLEGYSEDGSEVLRHVSGEDHASPESHKRDWRGKNALIFNPFWYWGQNAVAAPPDIADLAHYYVGQSTKNSSPERIAGLEFWVRSMAEPGIHGEPRDGGRLAVPEPAQIS